MQGCEQNAMVGNESKKVFPIGRFHSVSLILQIINIYFNCSGKFQFLEQKLFPNGTKNLNKNEMQKIRL